MGPPSFRRADHFFLKTRFNLVCFSLLLISFFCSGQEFTEIQRFTKSSIIPHQKVEVLENNNQLLVTSIMDGSTPGIWLSKDYFYLVPGLKYRLKVQGSSSRDAFVILTDNNYKPIIWPGVKLPSRLDTVCLDFEVIHEADKIRFGIMFNEPSKGDSFQIIDASLSREKINDGPPIYIGLLIMIIALTCYLFLRNHFFKVF